MERAGWGVTEGAGRAGKGGDWRERDHFRTLDDPLSLLQRLTAPGEIVNTDNSKATDQFMLGKWSIDKLRNTKMYESISYQNFPIQDAGLYHITREGKCHDIPACVGTCRVRGGALSPTLRAALTITCVYKHVLRAPDSQQAL